MYYMVGLLIAVLLTPIVPAIKGGGSVQEVLGP